MRKPNNDIYNGTNDRNRARVEWKIRVGSDITKGR